MKRTYYGIAGVNAYGVYDDYGKVMESRRYIASFKNKKFADFDSAKSWAEDTFADLQNCFFAEYDIDEIKKLNWCYFRRKSN